jgi:hypothetical protein
VPEQHLGADVRQAAAIRSGTVTTPHGVVTERVADLRETDNRFGHRQTPPFVRLSNLCATNEQFSQSVIAWQGRLSKLWAIID